MAKVSFDEFTSRARCTSSKHRLLDWRDDSCASSADCKVFVNGCATEYRLHLRALCRSSGFFTLFERGSKSVRLSLPQSCVDIFESILDFMYSYRCNDDSCFRKLGELSPSSALSALWLAGRLDIPDLHDFIIGFLERTMTPHSAHAYLSTAVELGQERLVDALTQLASQCLWSIPEGACAGLPLEVVEGLLEGSCVSEARGCVVVSCLKAREAEGKLEEEVFRRLMLKLVNDSHASRALAGVESVEAEVAQREMDSDGEDICSLKSISAEDAAALLGLARRFGDAEVEGRCLRRMARGFSVLGAEDLARLPARVVQELLNDDELEVGPVSWRCGKHR